MFELNTIVCGDCLSVMAGMKDDSVDLVVTDPPFGISYVSARPKRPWGIHVPIEGDDAQIWETWPKIIKEMYRISKMDTACFIFTRWDCWSKLESLLAPWVMKNMIVWDKGTHSAGDLKGNFGFAHELICFAVKGRPKIRGRRPWNIWRVPRVVVDNLCHPMEKPTSLLQIAIRAMSDKNSVVFDPFIGSGSTAVAALKLGRRFYGCDINPDYIKLAKKRIEETRLETAQMEMPLV